MWALVQQAIEHGGRQRLVVAKARAHCVNGKLLATAWVRTRYLVANYESG
jgi:hypothetical protein